MNVLEAGQVEPALTVRCPICEVAPGESCVESVFSTSFARLDQAQEIVASQTQYTVGRLRLDGWDEGAMGHRSRAPHVYRVHAAEIAAAVAVDDVALPAVAVEDFGRYREECRVFGIPGVDRATWWARYSADYAWAVELAAPSPVTVQRPGGGAGGVSSTAPNHLGSVA